jgi:hypothetical protein
MGGVCSTYGEDEKYIRNLFEIVKEGDHLEDLGID